MEKYAINGKGIYVVESHKDVLSAWAEIRRLLPVAPLLITLDYHADTREAFHQWALEKSGSNPDGRARLIEQCVRSIDYNDSASVASAADTLRNDEHIDAAIRSGLIDFAMVVSHGMHPPTQPVEIARFYHDYPFATSLGFAPPDGPYTYQIPKSRVFYVDSGCYVGCTKAVHDQDCVRLRHDQAIDSPFLSRVLEHMDVICGTSTGIAVRERDYVVDIDLDYFCTAKSAHPDDTSTFYALLAGAVAVTIATEPDYVESCRLEGESITADRLLHEMMNHLRRAVECGRAIE